MKNIDYGKISALHNAGWPGDKIADELNLSRDEYNTVLMDLLDLLDKKIKSLENRYRLVARILKN